MRSLIKYFIMLDREGLTQKLEQALYLTSDVLDRSLISDISTYIHAREWEVCFEVLCANLYEYELPISKQAHELLKDIGLTIKAKRDYGKLLEPQIIPNS